MTDAEKVLGSRVDRILSGAPDGPEEPRTDVLGVEGVCGIHKRPFLLLLEQRDVGTWCARRSYPLPGSLAEAPVQALVERQGVAVRSLSSTTFTGSFVMARDYVGCAWCLDAGVLKCGCGALGCQGASRMHEGHKDVLCGTCDRWQCLTAPKGISMGSIAGRAVFAGRTMKVEVLRPELVSRDAGPRMIAAAEEKALVRRRG